MFEWEHKKTYLKIGAVVKVKRNIIIALFIRIVSYFVDTIIFSKQKISVLAECVLCTVPNPQQVLWVSSPQL